MIPAWRERLPNNFSVDALSWLVRAAMQSEIDDLRAALAICKQAIMEMDHAHFGPNWFTKGVDGANSQFILWRDRAIRALKDAP